MAQEEEIRSKQQGTWFLLVHFLQSERIGVRKIKSNCWPIICLYYESFTTGWGLKMLMKEHILDFCFVHQYYLLEARPI